VVAAEVARFAIRENAIVASVGAGGLPDPQAGTAASGQGAFYLKIDGRHLAALLRTDRETWSADDIRVASTLNESTLHVRADPEELKGSLTIDFGR
jgi:hypothetical protein